ncbi:MAG: hypothetical protein K2I88_02380 [Anaeroplasmataceae bacterium]|nr:hypothetical protein [Anaeroplasmataceae bacterium]
MSKEFKSILGSCKNLNHLIKDKFAYFGKITYDYSNEIKNYNNTIVLTKERENHILERHPEMKIYISELIEYINSPDVILSDKKYNDTKNIIKYVEEKSFIFITVKFAKPDDLVLSSIISARYQIIRKNKKR